MTEISVEQNLLDDNARAAAANRVRFAHHGVYVMNLMSGPGAGKTTLLERTADALKGRLRMAVIAGDIETTRDADRIKRHGVPVTTLNTKGSCHLEAAQIDQAASEFNLSELDLLVVENVGNLVCPAEFDLGEHDKVMILSVTEGHDKPAKYPLMFQESRALLLSKIDLLPYLDFDEGAALRDARALNPKLEVLRLSTKSGEGFDAWIAWLVARAAAARGGR